MIRGLATIVTAAAVTLAPTQLREAVASDAATFIGSGPNLSIGVVEHASPMNPRTYLVTRASRAGIVGVQLRCLLEVIRRESHFHPRSYNKTAVKTPAGPKHAGGMFQILGMNPRTPLDRQVQAGLAYAKQRYGTWCNALAHHNQHGWY